MKERERERWKVKWMGAITGLTCRANEVKQWWRETDLISLKPPMYSLVVQLEPAV